MAGEMGGGDAMRRVEMGWWGRSELALQLGRVFPAAASFWRGLEISMLHSGPTGHDEIF